MPPILVLHSHEGILLGIPEPNLAKGGHGSASITWLKYIPASITWPKYIPASPFPIPLIVQSKSDPTIVPRQLFLLGDKNFKSYNNRDRHKIKKNDLIQRNLLRAAD